MIDYRVYPFRKEEKIRYAVQYMCLCGAVAWLFYRSVLAELVSFLFLPVLLRRKNRELAKGRRWQLNLEFQDALNSMSNGLNAGYSMENAVPAAIKDLSFLYDDSSCMIQELKGIQKHLKMNENLEDLFLELGERSGVDDIKNFAEVYKTAKRTGGDVMKIMQRTSRTIADKIEIKREIRTLVTAKQFEGKIMNVIPFGIILYLWTGSPGFLDPLYHNLPGCVLMTVLLGIYCAACILSEKIMDISI